MSREVVPLANPYSHGSNPCALAIYLHLHGAILIIILHILGGQSMDYIDFAKVLDNVYNDFIEGKTSIDLQNTTEEELKKNIINFIDNAIET